MRYDHLCMSVDAQRPGRGWLWFAAAASLIILYVGLLIVHAATRRPQIDEAMFASAAWTLDTTGYMGTAILDPKGWGLVNVDKRSYYMFPLYPLLLAGLFPLTGPSLWVLRGLSIMSMLVLLWLLYQLLRRIGIARESAILAVILAAADYHMQVGASFGRYDVLVAALGFGGYVSYITLRQRSLAAALLVSNLCIAASGITHPNGLMYFLVLWGMVLMRDGRDVFSPKVLGAALLPYVAGALLWSAYILKDPEVFRAQMRSNSYSRVGITHPAAAVIAEVRQRYLPSLGFPPAGPGGSGGAPIRLKVIPLLLYTFGILMTSLHPRIRREPGVKTLLVITGGHFLYLTFFEGMKFSYYLVHILPLYTSCTAVSIHYLWEQRPQILPRLAISSVLVVVAAVEVGGVLLRIRQNTYGRSYLPAVRYLREHAAPDDMIMGTGDLAFGLNFAPNLVDDIRFGAITGTRPKFIVVEDTYGDNLRGWKDGRAADREVYRYATAELASEYSVVYDDRSVFRVYQRKPEASGPTSVTEYRGR